MIIIYNILFISFLNNNWLIAYQEYGEHGIPLNNLLLTDLFPFATGAVVGT